MKVYAKGLVTVLALAACSSTTGLLEERSARADSRTEMLRNQSGEQVQYHGGPVTTNVQVIGVLWGPNVNPEVASNIGGFYQAIAPSPYVGQLGEYSTKGLDGGSNQTIGTGSLPTVITITPSITATTVDESQVGAELFHQIQTGKLPAPRTDCAGHVNTVYMVDMPQGITLSFYGNTVCQALCDYHATATSAGTVLYYSVFPDMYPGSPCNGYCGTNSAPFDNVTANHSAELGNLITDPDLGGGWFDPNGEGIGFVCQSGMPSYSLVSGYVVQRLWSNALDGCVATGGSDYDGGTHELPDASAFDAAAFDGSSGCAGSVGDAAEPDAPGAETGTDSGGSDASMPDGASADASAYEAGSPDGSSADASSADAGTGGGGSGGSGGCSCHATGGSAGSQLGTGSLAVLGLALVARSRRRRCTRPRRPRRRSRSSASPERSSRR